MKSATITYQICETCANAFLALDGISQAHSVLTLLSFGSKKVASLDPVQQIKDSLDKNDQAPFTCLWCGIEFNTGTKQLENIAIEV